MSSRHLARFLQNVFKTSWKTKNCYSQDVLKRSSRHALKTSSRRLEDQQIFAGSELVKNTDYNGKTSKIENKITSVSGLASTSALTAVEKKVLGVSSLAKKTDNKTKLSEI